MGRKQRKKKAKKKKEQPKTSQEMNGFFTVSLAVVMLTSLLSFSYGQGTIHWLGAIGYTIGWVLVGIFGISSYFAAVYLGWFGWRMLFRKSINNPRSKHLMMGTIIVSFSILLCLVEDQFPHVGESLNFFFYTQLWNRKLHFHLGGSPLYYLYKDLPIFNLKHLLNSMGVAIIFSITLISSFLILAKINLKEIWKRLVKKYVDSNWTFKLRLNPKENDNHFLRYVKLRIPHFSAQQSLQNSSLSKRSDILLIKPERNLKERPSLTRKMLEEAGDVILPSPHHQEDLPPSQKLNIQGDRKSRREAALIAQRIHLGDFSDFQPPSFQLLTNPKNVDQTSLKKDLRRQAEVLEETLLSFSIEAKVGQINCGPTITSFEVHPAIGVKVQKIKALENDIALNMEAKSIRILAPIPGKAAIGIEVPNPHPQEVSFKEMLNAYLQRENKFQIPVLLGKRVNGEYVIEDLSRMPHLIIAGATGSGKSVCINTIIMSILMTSKPDEIKFLMVDPKKVELTPYSKLPHMLAPVITGASGACTALGWLVKEMENRYELLKMVGFRNLIAFNRRQRNEEFEASLKKEIPSKMPYIVCIIDELADLMMVASKDTETYIARIAQMARAVGIHLILATQRPSREVITGLIKANFPTRISFKVSSRVNSQIILDEIGAESLLGNGDLLFLPPGSHHLIRAQGAYIRDQDITSVIKSICAQAPPNYIIPSFDDIEGELDPLGDPFDDNAKDTLYDQALDVVMKTGNASTTFLQRKLKIGYARAASIIDQLETNQIISAANGSKPRKVLVKETEDQ
ncbi:MAG: DNA translocase FtsK [Waddliaceae bacterium]